jgi:hypothetical protein
VLERQGKVEADLRRDLEQLTARLETNRRGHEAEGQMYQVSQTDEGQMYQVRQTDEGQMYQVRQTDEGQMYQVRQTDERQMYQVRQTDEDMRPRDRCIR